MWRPYLRTLALAAVLLVVGAIGCASVGDLYPEDRTPVGTPSDTSEGRAPQAPSPSPSL